MHPGRQHRQSPSPDVDGLTGAARPARREKMISGFESWTGQMRGTQGQGCRPIGHFLHRLAYDAVPVPEPPKRLVSSVRRTVRGKVHQKLREAVTHRVRGLTSQDALRCPTNPDSGRGAASFPV